MNRSLLVLVFTLVALAPVYSQVFPLGNCTISASVPLINVNGESELVSDAVMTCTSTAPSVSTLVNITLTLNTDLTSRLMNPVTMDSEALLLIDEPQPGVPNSSNGFPYFGQVLGASGVMAGLAGSGNVYQGKQALLNQVTWFGVPYVSGAPGTMRVFRMTNIRANPAVIGVPAAIMSFLAISGSSIPIIASPINNLAQSANGFSFSSSVPASPVGALDLQIGELFPNAFLKRIENVGGPLTATFQDVPGTAYCTQSGFTPEFGAVTPGAIGSANTGTRFLVQISRIPHHVTSLTVPIEVTSSSTKLVAHFVAPPFGADFAAGTVLSGGGTTPVLVSAAHTAELLYEVTPAFPFNGVNGCTANDNFNFQATTVPATALHPATVVKFHAAPIDPTATASATAPEPRFVP